jgi:hypothetical protein
VSIHRRAARRDDNEGPIVEALRRIGADVRFLSGATVPDLLVGFHGVTFLLGVKRPAGAKGGKSRWRKYDVKGGRDTSDARPAEWKGGPWEIVTTPEEALRVLGLYLAEPRRQVL